MSHTWLRPLANVARFALAVSLSMGPALPTTAKSISAAGDSDTTPPISPAAVALTATKRDALLIDVDNDGQADPGDTLRYTVVANNTGDTDALGVVFSDTLDANTVLSGTVRVSPLAFANTYTTTRNTPLTIAPPGILSNDTGQPAPTAVPVTNAPTSAGGTITLAADGGFTYTPLTNFTGTDTYTYTATNSVGNDTAVITFTVQAPPDAVNDAYTATVNTPLTIAAPGVLANDSPNSAIISSYAATTTQGGTVTLDLNGSFIYTPSTNFISPPVDTFTYTLTNGLGSDTATVSVTVQPAGPPVAVNDTYTTTANTLLNVPAAGVLSNDTVNFASITAYAATTTQGGSVTLNANGSFSYTPPTNFVSPPTDAFTYTLTNGLGNSTATVSLTVNPPATPIAVDDVYTATANTPLNVPAAGVLGNDTVNFATITAYAATTSQGGTVALNANGSFSYSPPTNFISPPTDTFTYTLTNGLGNDTATVVITLNPPGAPVAVNDTYTTIANTTLNVGATGVLSNDTVNFAILTGYQANTARGGTVVLAASGAFTYTPPSNVVSPPNDTFTYTLGNLLGNSTATVSITIDPPGPPLAVNDTYTATQNTPRSFAAPACWRMTSSTLPPSPAIRRIPRRVARWCWLPAARSLIPRPLVLSARRMTPLLTP